MYVHVLCRTNYIRTNTIALQCAYNVSSLDILAVCILNDLWPTEGFSKSNKILY